MSSDQVAPFGALVPDFELAFIVFSALMNAGCLIYGAILAKRMRSCLPLLVLPAGLVTVVVEATVAHLGHVWHPRVGQTELYNSYGTSIPVYLAFVYSFYFGIAYLAALHAASINVLTRRRLWTAAGFVAIGAFAMEIPVVQSGLWIYFGTQSLWFFKGSLPICWVLMNVSCVFFAATVLLMARSILVGWRQLCFLPMSPIAAYMGHIGSGFPFYLVANSSYASNPVAVQASGIMTAINSVLIISFCIHLLTREFEGCHVCGSAEPPSGGA
ncbi:hypothetical protein [Solimonas soli]|uniref:hypothetical protein n=1 Tax=Solimonas soli TaxID=413479 RepID=UPI0012F811FE|nr:hypothetical protein [Solimonas soli]